ncbi:MAG: 2Fe-2S iron-sulfur cluster-binding protein [Terriglobales bacterium]
MRINGQAAMACSSLIDKLEQPIRLEPLSRFPVVRDLAVDRSVLFENLKQVKAWVPVDGTYDLGAGPRIDPAVQEQAYPLSRCMSCCLCMEVCPQFTEPTRFVGAAIINQVRLFNLHPAGWTDFLSCISGRIMKKTPDRCCPLHRRRTSPLTAATC